MGKKSLIKSTSKKKATTKKKKSVAKSATSKKTAAKAKGKAAAKKTKSASESLTLKKFETWKPEKLFVPSAEKKQDVVAPPVVAATDKKEAARIKTLLVKKFDLAAPAKKTTKKVVKSKATAKPKATAKAKATAKPKAAPKPKAKKKVKAVTVQDLVRKKFDSWKPEKLYTVAPIQRTYTSQPIITATDEAEIGRIKALMFQKFDLAAIEEAGKKYALELEKAAAEKAAAEKAAAEKAAAEKAAAEKAAAEKAAAEKAAAEKAAAEKAAAEKAAAEKAAAEKAAAEKAAAEKAAAEKAAAEKAAAEKAAAEKAAKESPAVTVTVKESEPTMEKTTKFMLAAVAAGFALIVLLVIGASMSNSSKFYLKPADGALEIWKGKFAPLGTEMVVSLPGVQAPEDLKAVYTKEEVYPLAFNVCLDKADALIDVSGMPDFELIKTHLDQTMVFAVTGDLRKAVNARLTRIDLMVLLYKAEVAQSRGTIDDLEAAIDYLKDAGKLDIDDGQASLIASNIDSIEERIAALEVTPVEPEVTVEAEPAPVAEITEAEESAEAEPAAEVAEESEH